jgi:ribosomal protein S18 acetylase RimI-like enzyme
MRISRYRIACLEDAEAITKLVNDAYRPTAGERGWTDESALVSGDRTSANGVKDAIAREKSVVLLGLLGEEIVACVHIERIRGDAHIGMLSVSPQLQGSGIGKEILAYAEKYAEDKYRAEKFVMLVVSLRSELLAFYRRRGYEPTGEVMDYPHSAGVGVPKRNDLKIQVLEKNVKKVGGL